MNPGSPVTPNPPFCDQFINNDLSDGGGAVNIEADGVSVVLGAQGAVIPGPNHIKLAVGDAGDSILDTWVFLEEGSFQCKSLVSCEPRTQGFWRRVCKKNHPDHEDRSILDPTLCEDLNPDPHSDPCERARSQFAAAQYKERVSDQCIDDSDGNEVAATMAEIAALIAEGTNQSCKQASDKAASLNEGGVSSP